MGVGLFNFLGYRVYLLFSAIILFFAFCLSYNLSSIILPNYLYYDDKRIFELGLLLAISVILLLSRQQRQKWLDTFFILPRFTRYAIAVILCLGILSSFFSFVPKAAFLEVALYVLLFILGLMVCANYSTVQFRKLLLGVLVLSILMYSATFWITYISNILHSNMHTNPYLNVMPGFLNVRFFSQYQIWTLPLISLPIYLCRKLTLKLFFILLAAAWWALCIYSKTKGIWFCLAVADVLILAIGGRQALKWSLQQAGLAATGILFYFLLFKGLPAVIVHLFLHSIHDLQFYQHRISAVSGSISERLILWHRAIELAFQYPWLGVGPMHFAYFPNPIAAHPHNSILLIAAEWGIGAALLCVLLFCAAGWALLKMFYKMTHSREEGKTDVIVFMSLFWSFLAGSAYSCISGVIVMPLSQITMVIVIGALLGFYQSKRAGATAHVAVTRFPVYKPGLLIVVIVMALFSIYYGIFPTIKYLPGIEVTYFEAHYPARLLPRFWSLGWIRPVFEYRS